MSTRWSINITPVERAARIVLGAAAVLVGLVLLTGAASTWAVALELLLVLAVSTWSSPARSGTARCTPASVTCRSRWKDEGHEHAPLDGPPPAPRPAARAVCVHGPDDDEPDS